MAKVTKTVDGQAYDAATGELAEPRPKRGPRGRVLRSPEEEAEAERVREERKAAARERLAALRALDPACEAEGDPPVVWKNLVQLHPDAAPPLPLLSLERLSGKGQPGSRLVVAARYVDGMSGGEPKHYASLFTTYRGSAGLLLRSQGVAVRAEELRAVGKALADYADRLDAARGVVKTCECGDPIFEVGEDACVSCGEAAAALAEHPEELLPCPDCGALSRADSGSCPKCGSGAEAKGDPHV
jgi:hypothetical protein